MADKIFPTHIVAAYGIIKNNSDDILMIKHRKNDIWGFPGGQVEVGENLIDAVKRETMEESGAVITVDKLYCVCSNTCTYQGYNGYGTVPTKVMFGFICTYIGGELSVSDETSQTNWIKSNKVCDLLTTPDLIEKYNAFLNFDGNIKYLEYVTRPDFNLNLSRLI
ncbi:MAG: NUDIX hydrolase [Eubacteriales bacterium]